MDAARTGGNSGWLPDVIAVSRRRHRWRLGAWQESLHRDLATLRDWADAGPVDLYLVGGLGLAVRSAQFRRNHADIDLALFTDDLPRFTDYLSDCGYHWARPVLGLAVSPWHRVDLARSVPDPGPARALRVSRATNTRVRHSAVRTDFMDVMLMRRGDTGVTMLGDEVDVPWDDFLPARPVVGSRRLWLPNVRYKRHLPARWPRQRRDLIHAG